MDGEKQTILNNILCINRDLLLPILLRFIEGQDEGVQCEAINALLRLDAATQLDTVLTGLGNANRMVRERFMRVEP